MFTQTFHQLEQREVPLYNQGKIESTLPFTNGDIPKFKYKHDQKKQSHFKTRRPHPCTFTIFIGDCGGMRS